jgi:hypothetical protein
VSDEPHLIDRLVSYTERARAMRDELVAMNGAGKIGLFAAEIDDLVHSLIADLNHRRQEIDRLTHALAGARAQK